uniref:Uncharacterized protein n=1 Tax=Myoviridae sp. ctLnO19 TaxID=2825085 RepID=A0A8S5P1P3_9CAUD|nr:MAG TPA: hypothetical protein [Myoviridae sp. ctLnO19]DAJ69105.1 MAG TPA: hypothetical protein [Caudoviricetes sp.]
MVSSTNLDSSSLSYPLLFQVRGIVHYFIFSG